MGYGEHWLPGRREDQLAMAKNWFRVLEDTADAWSVLSLHPPRRLGQDGVLLHLL